MYEFVDRVPTLDEHRALARSVDWEDHFAYPAIGDSLSASLRGCVVLSDNAAVGMARLVGDGSHYFYVQDVIVHPHHSDSGLATQLVQRLVDWIARTAPADAVVGLFASPEAMGVYEDLGFATGDSTGMLLEVAVSR